MSTTLLASVQKKTTLVFLYNLLNMFPDKMWAVMQEKNAQKTRQPKTADLAPGE